MKILAIVVKPQEIKDEKYFATENDFELQLASFDLVKVKKYNVIITQNKKRN